MQSDTWKCADALPHIAMAIGEKRLFRPDSVTLAEETFFRILDLLSKKHVIHDTAAGLVLPDATKEKNWVYMARGDLKLSTLQRTLDDVFASFGKDMYVGQHMRGHGDRFSQGGWQRDAARALAPAVH
jgi:hypothetical protein